MDAANRLRVGFAAAFLLISLNLLVPLLGSGWVMEAIEQHERQEQINVKTKLLLSALKDGETGQRGFVISGRDDFLTPLFQGYGDVDRFLLSLRQEYDGDVVLQPRFAGLASMIESQRDYFAEIIELRRSEGLVAASERIGASQGKRQMDALRHQLDDILAELERRQATLQQEIASRERTRDVVLLLTAIVDLAMLVALFMLTFRILRQARKSQTRLQGLSDQLALGVSQLEQRNREISLLSRMAEAMHSSNRHDECFDIIRRFAQQLFPRNQGCLFLYHPSRDVLEDVASWGDWPASKEIFEPEQCWAIRRGQRHLARDAEKDLLCPHLRHHPVPDKGFLCMPLMAQGEPLGVLSLGVVEGHASDLVEAFAEQVSLGISNLSLRESLRQQSLVDALTGLHNRRFLDETLRRELLRAARKEMPMAVIMLDVDHFKRFNDTYGHEAGDLVLRQVATEMKRNVRSSDLVCRYGGEEFAVILPEIGAQDALARCEAMRVAVTRIQLRYGGQPLGPISISLGMAFFPHDGATPEALLQAADTALYQAKDSGRNRICVFGAAVAEVSPDPAPQGAAARQSGIPVGPEVAPPTPV